MTAREDLGEAILLIQDIADYDPNGRYGRQAREAIAILEQLLGVAQGPARDDELDRRAQLSINHHAAVELVRRFELESMALHKIQKLWLIKEIGALLNATPVSSTHAREGQS